MILLRTALARMLRMTIMGERLTATGLTLDQEKAEMLKLYAVGRSIDYVREQMPGYSWATYYRRVRSALDEILPLRVEELRKVQDIQLDRLTDKVIDHVDSPDPDISLKAVNTLLRILERRARLHGLDAPVQVSGHVEVVTISEETQRRILEAKARLESMVQSEGPAALRAVE